MSFSIISAHDKNFGIGMNNIIPWYISEDFKWFKKNTNGKIVIMGMNTYFSLPDKFRPLPNRENLVLCDDLIKKEIIEKEGATVFSSLDDIIEYCKDKDCFVIGGASIYSQFINISEKLYLTEIDNEFTCDTFFPKFNHNDWTNVYKSNILFDDSDTIHYRFNIYEKNNTIQ